MDKNLDENRQKLIGKEFPCPLCKKDFEIRLDKNDKPYGVCDPCGVQLFIRKAVGIQKLADKVLSIWD